MIATGERKLWTERINPVWRNPFAPQGERPTLAYEFMANNGISLAAVPEKGIFRYDGGARQMGSAEVTDFENAAHLVKLDTGTVPERLTAVAWGMQVFGMLKEQFTPQDALYVIERYWNDIYAAETGEAIEEIQKAHKKNLALDRAIIIFPSSA